MASADLRSETSGFVDNWQSGKSLAACNLHMLTSGDSCDVSFRVGQNEKLFRGHRYVLISRSCVFHAMLCGSFSEKDDIKIPDAEEESFAEFLKFLYTNDATLTADNVTGLLYLSKKYAVGGLEHLCLTYLDESLSPDNACTILEQTHRFDEKELYDKALKVILQNGDVSCDNPGFKDLCHECLEKVVKSEDLNAKPLTVFKAAITWSEAECERQGKDVTPENERCVLGTTLFDIPFTQMAAEEFAKYIVPTNILLSDESTKLFCFFTLSVADVAPFRVKSERKPLDETRGNYHEVSIYESSRLSNKSLPLCTWIILKPENDIVLRGMKVYCCKTTLSSRYEVLIEKLFQRDVCSAVVTGQSMGENEVVIQLPKPCLLKASTR